jgi:hypothetical protein
MKKYKLVYVKAGHVYGSESGIPSVNHLNTEFFDGGHYCGKEEQAAIVSFLKKYLY